MLHDFSQNDRMGEPIPYAPTLEQRQQDNALVIRYAALIKRIAYRVLSRLPPNVQVDDLIQAGSIGLLEAGKNYDPAQGASFETYAGIRIRGAMLDEVRRSDWTPRSVHRKARQVAEAMRAIENQQGRDARDAEVAAAMGLSLADYQQILQDAAGCRVVSLNELMESGELNVENNRVFLPNPYDSLQQQAFNQALTKAIASLPDRERLIISLYYDDDLTLRAIGHKLGVSESRVCQIHSQAILRLQARLVDWLDLHTEQV